MNGLVSASGPMSARPVDAAVPADQIIAEYRPIVLVFLPNTNELQRFILSDAFDDLNKNYQLRFVFSSEDAEKMHAAAPALLRPDNSYPFDIPTERYREWVQVFKLSCFLYADRSVSFALRVGATPIERPEFEIRLLRAAWKLAARLRPLLRRTPQLRARWGKPSYQALETIDKFVASDDWVNQLFNPHHVRLRERLDRLKPYGPLTDLLERVDPVFCVLPTSLLDNYCNDLLLAANSTGHTVVALQSGWDNLSSKGIIHHSPQFIGVWGPQSAVHARKIQGVDEGAIAVLGSPHYEFLTPATNQEREKFRAAIGVSPDTRLVLFGGSFRQFDETSVLKRLEAQIESGEFGPEPIKILYRPHPWRKERLQEDNFFDLNWKHVVFDPDMQDRYLRSKADPRYLATAPMFDMAYLAIVLSSVDVVISPMSTLLIEALIIDRPTMAVAFGDDKHTYNPAVSAKMTHFQELKKSKILEWCEDEDGFEASCRRLIECCGRTNDPELRRKALDRIVLLDDRSYSQRLGALARDTIEPIARRRRAKRAGRNRGSQSHIYHAHIVAKDYCGLPAAKDVPGHWIHGWFPSYHSVDPLVFATHKQLNVDKENQDFRAQVEREKEMVPQWMGRKDQEIYLREHGYRQVRAIGLPFAYLPEVKVPRIPGSLLVMPPHGHRTHGPGDRLAEAYADAIADKRSAFSEVWLCLNVDDFRRGEWIEAFRKRNIPLLIGADPGDRHTLYRFKRLLSTFEYVTTNGFGSHIVYAAAAGAKISIFGPFAECPRNAMADCFVAKVKPSLTSVLLELQSEATMRKHHAALFTEPERAVTQELWGRKEIGADVRLGPDELKDLFGWHDSAPGVIGGAIRQTSLAGAAARRLN